jgi:type II secretory pathway component GspD/PulD (secretin)
VTLDDALDAITLAGGFRYRKRGNLYYVYKPREERDPQSERLQMRIFKLEYAELDKIHEILDSIPGTRLIKIHEASKTVIVEDTPENIQKIETIIKYWDTMPKQVMIEAKILSVDLTEDMSLGIDWDKILGDVRLATGGFSTAVLPDGEPISPVPEGGTGIFGNMLVGAGTAHQFAAAIDALQTRTRVNTLSTPKVLAIHGRPAKVQVGGQQGYRLTTVNQGISTESIEFIDTGIVLEITPYIDDEGNVLLHVQPSITSATLEVGGIPVTNTALVSTYLLAKSGETVLIGGLIQDSKSKEREMIPCLGDIPILGLLFGQSSRRIDKSELVVLITLQVLDAGKIRIDQAEAIEKTRQMEKNFKAEPLPSHEQFREFLLPSSDPFEQIQGGADSESKRGGVP